MPSMLYLKLGDDIKGESTDSDHVEWVELSSFGWGVSQPVSQSSGTGGRVAGGCQFSDFTCTKTVDNASADIMKFCAAGTHIPMVTIDVVESTGQKHTFIKYELEDVIISGSSPSGGGGGDKPMESLTLNYGKFRQTYTPLDHQGNPGTPITRGWDLETNQPLA